MGIDSSVERRSMLFFEQDIAQKQNYDFFVKQFDYLRQRCRRSSPKMIHEKHDEWISLWNNLPDSLK